MEIEQEHRIGNLSAYKFYSIVCKGILISLVFVLFGSVSHLAYTFNTVEGAGSHIVGWIIALGVESGLMWIAFGLSEKRKNNDKSRLWLLTFFMFGFCFINFVGNYYYGISRYLENEQLLYVDFLKVDLMIHFKTLLLSGSLPLIALALIEIYAIFTHRKGLEEKKQKRIEKQRINVVKPKAIDTGKKSKIIAATKKTRKTPKKKPKEIIQDEIDYMSDKKKDEIDVSEL